MKKNEVPTIVEKQEQQTQEVKKAVIPLPPFKEIELPYAGKTVKMRKPIVRDIKALANITNQEIKTYHLISNLTGLSIDEIDMLDYPDFSVLNKELESFL